MDINKLKIGDLVEFTPEDNHQEWRSNEKRKRLLIQEVGPPPWVVTDIEPARQGHPTQGWINVNDLRFKLRVERFQRYIPDTNKMNRQRLRESREKDRQNG